VEIGVRESNMLRANGARGVGGEVPSPGLEKKKVRQTNPQRRTVTKSKRFIAKKRRGKDGLSPRKNGI